MKDAKGHGSNGRARTPRGTASGFAGRDALGRTYTAAIRDFDRFPSQNPIFPNPDDYRTPSSNEEAAKSLMTSLNRTQEPIHPSMVLRSPRDK